MTGGQLRKVIAVGDSFKGKTIAGLNFSRAGLFGDPLAFQATFSDGSQGVFKMDLGTPQSEVRITLVESVEGDLRLTFTAVAGRSYIVQTRSDIFSGAWANLPGDPMASVGNTAQVRLPIVVAQKQQFFRVQEAP
jgi:hypothetical protein